MSCYREIPSPVGELLLVADADHVTEICFQKPGLKKNPSPDWQKGSPLLNELTRQLEAYFSGGLQQFDVPLKPEGTPFQQVVWGALQTIPYGETISYGELASLIGRPMASRAVGAANGRNPIPILIPCHRVIGSDGSLTGYGGGLDIKRILLQVEGHPEYGASRRGLFENRCI